MLKVPSVAKSQSVLASCQPKGSGSFVENQRFEWNVEVLVTKAKDFTYYVGEGPLYWYRIDWYPSICPDHPHAPFTPTISYIAPNCPYEIIENCIVLPPDCPCNPPCLPGSCIQRDIEVWHMVATSVEHLCERINQECCHRKPPGFIRRVRQYLRPALCCDVPWPTPDTIDAYVDVNFIVCECGNLVDPCINRFIYPEHINRCGIHGPVFIGPDAIQANTIKLTDDIFGTPISLLTEKVDTTATEIMPLPPPIKEVAPINRIINKFGPSIPEKVFCFHNLDVLSIFSDYVKKNKIVFKDMDLFYNNLYKSWQTNKYFRNNDEEWKFTVEWTPAQESEKDICGFKFNLSIDRKLSGNTLKSKLIISAKLNDFLNKDRNFELDFEFNTKTSTFISKKDAFLQFKMITDNIGVFNNGFNFKVKMKG